MLKKQTVWLLTMLSLMIVLSFYYMTSSDSNEVAFLENGKDEADKTEATEEAKGDDAQVDNIANMGEDELFTNIRLEVQDERSKELSRLEDVVASGTTSTEEKNQAYENIEVLEQRASKETILEDSILATADYKDVLVRFDKNDDGKVHVSVKVSDDLSNKEVVNIMQMVRDEFGEITVDVNQQPVES